MRQLLLSHGVKKDELYAVTGKDFHYLAHVLRLEPGNAIGGVDAAGIRYRLVLKRREKDRLVFQVTDAADVKKNDEAAFELLICLPKPATMDLIVRMMTELGVSRIVPVTSEHSLLKERDIPRLADRKRRWEKIARSALEQSGRRTLPVIGDIIPFREIEEESGNEGCLALFAHETAAPDAMLHRAVAQKNQRSVRFLVGPEGGLSGREALDLKKKGFLPVFLGDNILRTETAALALGAALKILIMERTAWKPK